MPGSARLPTKVLCSVESLPVLDGRIYSGRRHVQCVVGLWKESTAALSGQLLRCGFRESGISSVQCHGCCSRSASREGRPVWYDKQLDKHAEEAQLPKSAQSPIPPKRSGKTLMKGGDNEVYRSFSSIFHETGGVNVAFRSAPVFRTAVTEANLRPESTAMVRNRRAEEVAAEDPTNGS